jgi:hypothetical protein
MQAAAAAQKAACRPAGAAQRSLRVCECGGHVLKDSHALGGPCTLPAPDSEDAGGLRLWLWLLLLLCRGRSGRQGPGGRCAGISERGCCSAPRRPHRTASWLRKSLLWLLLLLLLRADGLSLRTRQCRVV